MKVSPLPYEARIATGFTHVAEIVAADLTQVTAATAQTIELIPVALGSLVEKAAVLVETAFADASDTAFNSVTVEVGDGGSAARFLAAQQVNVNGTEVMAKGGTGTQTPGGAPTPGGTQTGVPAGQFMPGYTFPQMQPLQLPASGLNFANIYKLSSGG
jgi:hypothetical protein